ncbi:sugar ABC transporter permease [Bacillus sp. AFS055030]|uniref:carbohydrate ABC transporter permease n=1 Tax=Bacillus sp. AFS055030 TaxID=2033507 RepID=UPI000BFC2276|nr:sugar ABC transporter permease [Bacillus sp. AFS055030]PGL70097.1 ABC transporter permease [Bacillus sp. AFS055030]
MNNIFTRLVNSKKTVGYIFILPWVIGFAVFTAYPILYSLYLSFFNVIITTNGIKTKFAKWANYQDAFTTDVEFLKEIGDFAGHVVVSVPIIVIIALIIAILLNQPIKFRGFFRTIFFLPVIISSGPVLNKLTEQGVTAIPEIKQYVFYKLAAENPGFFSNLFLYIMDNMVLLLWFTGVQILIFIAALQKVDNQIYEAAKIDGASTWEIFWKITLPTLFPMILVNIIYTTVMYSISTMNPIIEHIKKNMFKIETGFGYASALSWIYFVIITIILLIMVWLVVFLERKK